MSVSRNLTDEQRAAIRAERDAIIARVMSGEDRPKRAKASPKRSSQGRGRKGPRPERRKIDDARVKTMKDEGLTGSEIARRLGVDRQTVSRALQRLGMAPGGPGRPRREKCDRGHDLAIHGRERTKPDGSKDGRECKECKKAGGRALWRARQERKKNEATEDQWALPVPAE